MSKYATVEELLRKKMQFYHRDCPADTVVNGYRDLATCTCGIDSQIRDALVAIEQLIYDRLIGDDQFQVSADGSHRRQGSESRNSLRKKQRERLGRILRSQSDD